MSTDANRSYSSTSTVEVDPAPVSRFVIWSEATLAECVADDRKWLQEVLESFHVTELSQLTEVSPTSSSCEAEVARFLEIYDLGRLVISGENFQEVWFTPVEEMALPERTSTQLRAAGFNYGIEVARESPAAVRARAQLCLAEMTALEECLKRCQLRWRFPAEPWLFEHAPEIRAVINAPPTCQTTAARSVPLTIEEEFESLLGESASPPERDVARAHLGWEDGIPKNLDEVSLLFGISPDRVREVLSAVLKPGRAAEETLILDAVDRYVGWSPLESAEFVESELAEAQLTQGRTRLEAVAATAGYLGRARKWHIETVDGRRVVLNDQGRRLRRIFEAAARRWVTLHGAASVGRLNVVLGDLLSEGQVRLCCDLSRSLRWLDEGREWFTIDAPRNRVLTRLQKILTWQAAVPVEETLEAVLRDEQMREVELPESIFRTLCELQPWCRLVGDQLQRSEPWLGTDAETSEFRLAELLRELGPVMRRHDLEERARKQGLDEAAVRTHIAHSNLLYQPSADLVALIGHRNAPLRKAALSEALHELVTRLTGGTGEPERRRSLVELCPWDQLETVLSKHWTAMLASNWESLNEMTSLIDDREVSGEAAFGLAFMAFAAWVGRTEVDPESLWPEVHLAMPAGLRRMVFEANAQLRSETKRAIEAACETFHLRRGFSHQGPGYVRTIQLQFGIGQGWSNVSAHHAPASISYLLDETNENYSARFTEFWEVYRRFRAGVQELEEDLGALAQNPWVPPGRLDDLERFARGEEDGPTSRTSRIFEPPTLVWSDGKPRLRLHLARELDQLLVGDRWDLVVDGKKYRVRRDEDDGLEVRSLMDAPVEVEVGVELRAIEAALGEIRQKIRLLGEHPLVVFRGGRLVEMSDPAWSGTVYTLFIGDPRWKWTPFDDEEATRDLGDGWCALRVRLDDQGRLMDGAEPIWPLARGKAADLQTLAKPFARCDPGRSWGESVRVQVDGLAPGLELTALRLSGVTYPAREGGLEVELTPRLAMSRQTEAELICWDGRRRVIPCEWSGPAMSGFVAAHHGQWVPLEEKSDVTFLKGRKIQRLGGCDERADLVNGGEVCGKVDWDDTLHIERLGGWGEGLSTCRGPNEFHERQRLVKEIVDAGQLDRIGGDPERQQYRLTFAKAYEPAPAHRVEVWERGKSKPREVPIAAHDGRHWWLDLQGGVQCAGVAVFFGESRLGARWKPPLKFLDEIILHAPDWGECLDALVRWKAPLLHPELRQIARERCLADPVSSLKILYKAAKTEAGAFLLRSLFENAEIAPAAAGAVLRGAAILPRDRLALGTDPRVFQAAVAAAPALTTHLIVSGLRQIWREETDEWAAIANQLRFHVLEGHGLENAADRRWATSALEKARTETGRDQNFLRSLAPNQKTSWPFKPIPRARYYEGYPAFRRWIAASVLDRYRIHLEMGGSHEHQ